MTNTEVFTQPVFRYPDTNSSRAGIEYLNRKFENQKIAIIGLGGTGSYLLDQIAKTPVKEIHIFDGDIFQLHNAFRSPGAISTEKLETESGLKKVDYYFEIYSNMHSGIKPHAKYVMPSNIHELKGFSYVFISVDRNEARYNITKALLAMGVTFIDVGIGVNKFEDILNGAIRVTVGSTMKSNHLDLRIGSHEFDDNEYANNIQIADLNCLNAMFAILKWKKLSGFYQDMKQEHNNLFFISTNKLLNEDNQA
ncbi:MAG: ThiF family adenylyltransferase [Bacteroidota bacterium]